MSSHHLHPRRGVPESSAQSGQQQGLRSVYRALLACAVLFGTQLPAASYATTRPELITQEAGVDQNLNTQVDLELRFRSASRSQGSESGELALRELLIPGRPTLVVPVYYDCPRLCGLTLKGVSKVVNDLDFELGKDYKVLAVSFDPSETVEQARAKASENYGYLKHPERGPAGWDFLVGSQEQIRSLMTELGFRYTPDGTEFSHAAAMMLLTPDGKLSRYFPGVDHDVRDLRYAMIEASQGKIGGIVDHVFLYCFRFDPTKGKYTLVIMNFTRAVSLIGVLALLTLLIVLRMRERKNAG